MDLIKELKELLKENKINKNSSIEDKNNKFKRIEKIFKQIIEETHEENQDNYGYNQPALDFKLFQGNLKLNYEPTPICIKDIVSENRNYISNNIKNNFDLAVRELEISNKINIERIQELEKKIIVDNLIIENDIKVKERVIVDGTAGYVYEIKAILNENNEFELKYIVFRVYKDSYKGVRFKFDNRLGEFELKDIKKITENNIDEFDILIVKNEEDAVNYYLKQFKLEDKKENIIFLDKLYRLNFDFEKTRVLKLIELYPDFLEIFNDEYLKSEKPLAIKTKVSEMTKVVREKLSNRN